MAEGKTVRIAVDIGGTFVDAIRLDTESGEFTLHKSSTTPKEPWVGVMKALRNIDPLLSQIDTFTHGTTLGLNSLLERKGAKTGIITNKGFRDIFLIGRANVPDADMYNFQYQRPEPLVPRHRILGVGGRRDHRGEEDQILSKDDVRDASKTLIEGYGVESIAICFLYSYVSPEDENTAADLIREIYPDTKISISSNIAREHREYERTSTTVLDAYIRPVFERYMRRLEDDLAQEKFNGRFLVMRSGGGAMTADAAKLSPTNTIMSGPAGGIAGAEYFADLLDLDNLITFDVGGTSLDVCKIDNGIPATAFEATIENHPLLIPVYDIRSIGAGGGSIAWIEEGILKVGPHSAGAEPGPICYARGGQEPTVTDAALTLGYINSERFLAGGMQLDPSASQVGIENKLAIPLSMSKLAVAAGIFDIMLAKTVGAVRQITVERGKDPAESSLLGFGGAGPMLAPLVAYELGISKVIIPPVPSGFSAWGMLNADIVDDYSLTLVTLIDDILLEELESHFAELENEALRSLTHQGISDKRVLLMRQLELRYLGQEHALGISVGRPVDFSLIHEVFTEEHQNRYGHTMEAPIQVVNLRVRGIGQFSRPKLSEMPENSNLKISASSSKQAFCFVNRQFMQFSIYERSELARGGSIAGPALIDEGTSVTVIHSNQVLSVDRYGSLIISTGI
ncbi:MAG: methylhydantoinase [Acidiferrobacteraceae bacterium]|nr:methylhydantoinase [Acidiferrobacteraceae bacterium]